MCTWMIDEFGSKDQRQRYVPEMCTMALLGSYCLTEPEAGSDAGNIKTTAIRKKDHYLLSGTKVDPLKNVLEVNFLLFCCFCFQGIY